MGNNINSNWAMSFRKSTKHHFRERRAGQPGWWKL